MGGAQPLAATMAGASMLAVECDPSRIDRRLQTGYLDRKTASLDEALSILEKACAEGRAISVGLLGNCAEVLPEIVRRGVMPDMLTDQTSAHDPLNGYLPAGWTLEKAREMRAKDAAAVVRAAKQSIAVHVRAMLDLQARGAVTFDYGNNIRQMAKEEGVANAFDFPGFVPAYIRPLFCEGIGPFRWVALSGDPEDIFRTDAKVKELLPDDPHLHQWLDMARERIQFQGLPARICWVGLKDRARLGLAFNEMVARGELQAPIVIGRDHLDSGSVASPNRETEGMLDGSDAVSDWPLLNALLNTASGATWVSFHHGGGVGMGFSQHAGMVIVADGTPDGRPPAWPACSRNDPGSGVMRHADAGYELAIQCARENELDLPMAGGCGSMKLNARARQTHPADLRRVWREPVELSLAAECYAGIDAAAATVARVIAEGRVVYGVNTGFGLLASQRISPAELELLQRSIVLSHAAGVGAPMSEALVRLLLVLKINSLALGYSGVRRTVDRGARPAAGSRGLSVHAAKRARAGPRAIWPRWPT